MTILTKSSFVADDKDVLIKEKKGWAKVATQEAVAATGDPSLEAARRGGSVAVPEEIRRRQRQACFLCLALIALWFMLAVLTVAMFFHRYQRQHRVFTCGVTFMASDGPQYVHEELELDLPAGVEVMRVPKFGQRRPSVFVYDFRNNVTAIVDVLTDRCFITDLDRENVAPPENFTDLADKTESGYYSERVARVIERRFRVARRMSRQELVDTRSDSAIFYCFARRSFKLVPATDTPAVILPRRRRDTRPTSSESKAIDDPTQQPLKMVTMTKEGLVTLYEIDDRET